MGVLEKLALIEPCEKLGHRSAGDHRLIHGRLGVTSLGGREREQERRAGGSGRAALRAMEIGSGDLAAVLRKRLHALDQSAQLHEPFVGVGAVWRQGRGPVHIARQERRREGLARKERR